MVIFTSKETGKRFFGQTFQSWESQLPLEMKADDNAYLSSLDYRVVVPAIVGEAAVFAGSITGPIFGSLNGDNVLGTSSMRNGTCNS